MRNFEAEITREEPIIGEVVRERVYGNVRLVAEWGSHVTVRVEGEVSDIDAPAYVELFFHDVFLLMNLAQPGSFSGTIVVGGASEMHFDARLFEAASGLRRLSLAQVTAWYDALGIGTRQVAFDGVSTALFTLLHLSRREEDEQESIVRLAAASEALFRERQGRLFELRDAIWHSRVPVFHPMHDDALDPSVEDATREWIEVADDAAGAIIRALQERIEESSRSRAAGNA